MAAGIATLKEIGRPGFYDTLDDVSAKLMEGLKNEADHAGIDVTVDRVGSMLGLFFTPGPVLNFQDAKTSDLDRFAKYYQSMLAQGIYLAPSQFEAGFVSAAHDDEAIDNTLKAAKVAFSQL
jgi:glutamate-1-semialdehyde 2,1-aminomutase